MTTDTTDGPTTAGAPERGSRTERLLDAASSLTRLWRSDWAQWALACLSVTALAAIATSSAGLLAVLLVAALVGMLLGRPQLLFFGALAAAFVSHATGRMSGEELAAIAPHLQVPAIICLTIAFGRRKLARPARIEPAIGIARHATPDRPQETR